MIACVSPDRTVRSTPRRISFSPCSDATATWRSRISRVDIPLLLGVTYSPALAGTWVSTKTSFPSMVTGYTATGRIAGRAVGWPVRRSKRDPCSQHSIVQSSTSPSDSDTSAWLDASAIACTWPSSSRTTATGRPSTTTRTAPTSGSSSRDSTRCALTALPRSALRGALCSWFARSARSRRPLVLRRRVEAGRSHGRRQLGLDRGHEPLLDGGDADALDELGEEAADDQPPGLDLRDAAGLQVEELLVVEPAGGAGVARADDLAGLDLEVGHRVGTCPLGEHEVAVELVGVGALGGGADQHVADPHRVRGLALQRALVRDPAAAVRRVVVDERAVLQVLAGVGEVDAEHRGVAAGPGVADVGVDPHDLAAERDRDVLVPGVT